MIFLENHPIELSLLEEETEAMRELLKEANQNFVLEVREEVGVNTKNGQYSFKLDRNKFYEKSF